MNQTIYERNIDAFKKSQPYIVEVIEDIDLKDQDECIVFEGMNGCHVLKVKKEDGNYILYNSFYNPYKEAKEITQNIDYTINRSLILAIGVGMGYHLLEILNHLNEKSVLLVIERNKIIFKNLLYYVDLSDAILAGKIFFILGDFEKDELTIQIKSMLRKFFVNILSIQTQILPIADMNYVRYCKKILKCISDFKSTLMFTLGNSIDDTLIGIDNRIRNLPHIIKNPGLKDFMKKYGNIYKGKPAIIIASGPSLDKNIHQLQLAQGKALLLACDGSMESLKKHNIVPDVVSSVERIMLTYEAFYKGKKMPDDTVLAAPAVVRPEIFQTFNTKTLSLFKSEPIAEWFNKMVYDKGMVWSGASVAHQLMGLALALGADPIILVGQDLAYSPDGVSHTSEAAVKEKVDLSNIEIYVKDIHGRDVPTTFVWKKFLEIYENAISSLKINCIDATEGGAYIQGTKVMPLREVIENYCSEELPKFRTLIDSIEVEKEYIHRAYRKVLRSLIRLAKVYDVVVKRCEKSLAHNQHAKTLIENGIQTDEELDQVYDAIDYTEYKIVKKIRKDQGLNMFFQYPIMATINKINELGTEITWDVLARNLDIQKELLEVIIYYSKKMLFILKAGFEFIKEKAAEELNSDEISNIEYPHGILPK
ncbi:motility associated factor glycosyltransferase family protein [Thermotalea metallivorans]|uniref:6-hydroxymethylpterin diphosphokinase MptE-like domain-containing protein n=1 Tax=Thermotalea metallivorans TaxID=520762 RepID=A0A140L716_9FIRM|nr:6-hydroxymethylpterin diphosphokinase MptE-like protein [Thermotalea metallivorans]KXG76341.1 hypothetical protein AN619_12990 [Thermotalea metallivorans]